VCGRGVCIGRGGRAFYYTNIYCRISRGVCLGPRLGPAPAASGVPEVVADLNALRICTTCLQMRMHIHICLSVCLSIRHLQTLSHLLIVNKLFSLARTLARSHARARALSLSPPPRSPPPLTKPQN
jgi:hypothetical protein